MTTKKLKIPAANQFISDLHYRKWLSLNSWEDGGHTFEMLQKQGTHALIIVQIHPNGHGFEVWRPVTQSASIDHTMAAVEEYGNSQDVQQ